MPEEVARSSYRTCTRSRLEVRLEAEAAASRQRVEDPAQRAAILRYLDVNARDAALRLCLTTTMLRGPGFECRTWPRTRQGLDVVEVMSSNLICRLARLHIDVAR